MPLKEFQLFLVLFICSLIKSSDGGRKSPCLQSRNTASFNITRCPQDRKELENRSKLFKCEEQKQNCTTAKLYKYHCVLNSKGDGYIELCAPEVVIIGRRCTEYTTGGQFLQEHLENICTACPFKYKSSESYKYNECYKLEHPSTPSIMQEKKKEDSGDENISFVKQKDVGSVNDAVEDKEDIANEDGHSSSSVLIITLSVIGLLVAVFFVCFAVYKLSLHKRMCNTMSRHRDDKKPNVSQHETEIFPIEEI